MMQNTLDPTKVYTSYFANTRGIPFTKLVSIARKTPPGFNGLVASELAPPWDLVQAFKAGKISIEEFIYVYHDKILKRLDPNDICNKYAGKVLCCYEKNTFCHRQLVLLWLEANLGKEYVGGEVAF